MSERITTLDDLLSDPMVQLVMASDRVHPQEIRRLFERARARDSDQALVPPHMIRPDCPQGHLCA